MPSKDKQWVVYMVYCADNSIYTGITNDLEARLRTHNSGKGAKYTKTRLPVTLAAYWPCSDKSEASKLEYKHKQLTRAEKIKLISNG